MCRPLQHKIQTRVQHRAYRTQIHRQRKRLAKKIAEGYQPRPKRKYKSIANALTREDQEYEEWDKYRGFDGMERAVAFDREEQEQSERADGDEESAPHDSDESSAELEDQKDQEKDDDIGDDEEDEDEDEEYENWESFETELSALQRLTQHTGEETDTRNNLTGKTPKSFIQKLPKLVHNPPADTSHDREHDWQQTGTCPRSRLPGWCRWASACLLRCG